MPKGQQRGNREAKKPKKAKAAPAPAGSPYSLQTVKVQAPSSGPGKKR